MFLKKNTFLLTYVTCNSLKPNPDYYNKMGASQDCLLEGNGGWIWEQKGTGRRRVCNEVNNSRIKEETEEQQMGLSVPGWHM